MISTPARDGLQTLTLTLAGTLTEGQTIGQLAGDLLGDDGATLEAAKTLEGLVAEGPGAGQTWTVAVRVVISPTT